MFEHFPYVNMHELNLDWIIEQVKKAYSPDNPPDNLVLSVNGQTGEVVLYQDANVQLPSVESNQWNIYRLVASQNGQIARGIEFSGNGTARIINGTHRALIYTSENPPDYPVDSVNGQTGAVTIQVPFVNTTDELMQFATDSEDNYWGLRRNTTGGEAGIYLDTAGETVRAYITLMPEYEGEGTPQTFQLLTTNDIPETSGVVSVNGLTGVVHLFGTNIYRTDNSNQTINQAISTLENSTNSLNTRTGALEDGIAIVANGNTHPAIASGQFVYVKNHESLTEGLYTANSAIGTNASLTTSNLTADGSGGLNALKAKIGNVGNTDLQSQVTSLNSNTTAVTRHTRKTSFSLSDLQAAVADQDLAKHGLKVGDETTINGHTYVIAGLNVMKGTHSYTCTSNHVGLIVIPHTTHAWNASGKTNEGADGRGAGYSNCDLQYYLENDVVAMCNTDIGLAHLYAHRKMMGNAINETGYNRFGTATGCTSGWAWKENCYISALTEAQVYGGDHWSSSGYDTGEANTLLPVFSEYKHTEIFKNEYPWLRNVLSASQACIASDTGIAYGIDVSTAYHVAGLILYH